MDILKKMFGLNSNENDAALQNKGWVETLKYEEDKWMPPVKRVKNR